ncbi:hypothetical protein QUB24_29375 [Microcoleus sp. B9-D4]
MTSSVGEGGHSWHRPYKSLIFRRGNPTPTPRGCPETTKAWFSVGAIPRGCPETALRCDGGVSTTTINPKALLWWIVELLAVEAVNHQPIEALSSISLAQGIAAKI